jgi:uncharacterized protein YgiM (DUF1202 family)
VTGAGDNLNARVGPDTNSAVLTILQQGDMLRVINGPRQSQGFTWWQLQTSEGAAWAADGDNTSDWLVPAP